MGQRSLAVEQNLETKEKIEDTKIKSNEIGLIHLLEILCYSYMAREDNPLVLGTSWIS